MQEITYFIYFLKKEVRSDIFLIAQNKYDVPEPILELSNNVITFEPKEQNVPEIVHSFLTRPSFLDRIANYISTLDNSQ